MISSKHDKTYPLDILYTWHVALITNTIDACTQRFWSDLGIGPWHYVPFEFAEADARVNGKNTALRISAAVTQVGFLTLGFDQPLTSPNPYADMLLKRGGGAHHLAFAVADEDMARRQMREFGYGELLAADRIGPSGEGAAGYFDTVADLGTIIELSKVPAELPPIGKVFPSPGDAARSGPISVRETLHVTIATHDVERSVHFYEKVLGLGPWAVTTLGASGSYQGRTIQHTVKRAVTRIGTFVLALEQPIGPGGPLRAFIDSNGQGIHRIAFAVDDIHEATPEMERLGHASTFCTSESAYFDTEKTFGTMIELATPR